MSIFPVLALILATSLLEVIFTSWNARGGLVFALASFTLSTFDARLTLLACSLLALHIFLLSFSSLKFLLLTEEARTRQGFIYLLQESNWAHLQSKIKSLS